MLIPGRQMVTISFFVHTATGAPASSDQNKGAVCGNCGNCAVCGNRKVGAGGLELGFWIRGSSMIVVLTEFVCHISHT